MTAIDSIKKNLKEAAIKTKAAGEKFAHDHEAEINTVTTKVVETKNKVGESGIAKKAGKTFKECETKVEESELGKKVKTNVDKFAQEHSEEIEKVKAKLEEGAKKAGETFEQAMSVEEEQKAEESADAVADDENAEEFEASPPAAEEENMVDAKEPAAASEEEEEESGSAAVAEEEEEKADEQQADETPAADEEEKEKTNAGEKLKKAQEKVFHGTAFAVVAATAAFGAVLGKVRKQKKADAESEAAKPEEETSAAPEAADADAAEKKESSQSGPAEATMEDIKLVAEDISVSMQSATEDATDKEEAHKLLNPLAAKLAIVKAKFASMAAKRSNKNNKKGETATADSNEEGAAIEVTQNSQAGESIDVVESEEKQDNDKKEGMKHKAEEAAKKALDSAEKIAKEASAKFGAFFHKAESKEAEEVAESKEGDAAESKEEESAKPKEEEASESKEESAE